MANNNYIDNALGAMHISANLESYEQARSGYFTLIVEDLDNLVKVTYNGDPDNVADTYKYSNPKKLIQLSVIGAPIPTVDINVDSIRRGNDEIKFATTPKWNSSGSLKIADYVGLDTWGVINAWKELAYNTHTHKGGYMKDYKKTCTLIQYDQAYKEVRSWTLYGAFISRASSSSDLDKENSNVLAINATLEYDYAVVNDLTTVSA